MRLCDGPRATNYFGNEVYAYKINRALKYCICSRILYYNNANPVKGVNPDGVVHRYNIVNKCLVVVGHYYRHETFADFSRDICKIIQTLIYMYYFNRRWCEVRCLGTQKSSKPPNISHSFVPDLHPFVLSI